MRVREIGWGVKFNRVAYANPERDSEIQEWCIIYFSEFRVVALTKSKPPILPIAQILIFEICDSFYLEPV
ncbi:hypothetical protein JXJ21_05260 [candidate division KSB1 bacterium]|nr:hypothetical protein [candidate division KSB1 bacterium]